MDGLANFFIHREVAEDQASHLVGINFQYAAPAAAAVVFKLESGKVADPRVVLGHVAPVPWPSLKAEHALLGKKVTEATADEAGKAAVSRATPLSRNTYKVKLARVAVKRAILRAAQGGAHA